MTPSRSHLVIIPSYNTGPILLATVAAARAAWSPVWVVIDGSDDGSAEPLRDASQEGVRDGARDAAQEAAQDGFRLIELPHNAGKGAAVLAGLEQAAQQGFTHALVMDADGQHPPDAIRRFMAASQARPEAMILGLPVFGPEAPGLRVRGRRISNWWVNFETPGAGIGDSLFGFRVYPIEPLRRIMRGRRAMRRFDFDPEAVVRLAWAGVPAQNLPAAVRYVPVAEGGVSHFRYGRDNLLLTCMHLRLLGGFLRRLPRLLLQATVRGRRRR